jgi:hypothetical protein
MPANLAQAGGGVTPHTTAKPSLEGFDQVAVQAGRPVQKGDVPTEIGMRWDPDMETPCQ